MIKDLVGYQLVSLDDSGFVVRKNQDYKHFEFDEDYGDCCGYNEVNTTLFISEKELKDNPIITRVTIGETNNNNGSELVIIVFFGGSKMLSKIESESGSGSGWYYGATVTCKCVETKEEEILSSW